MTKEEQRTESFLQEHLENKYSLILHNDEVNTFDFVIDSLVEVCHHNRIQAEQCAMIAHLKGKCDILSGTKEELLLPQREMLRRKINVSIV